MHRIVEKDRICCYEVYSRVYFVLDRDRNADHDVFAGMFRSGPGRSSIDRIWVFSFL